MRTKKTQAESFNKLEIWWLKRNEYLHPGIGYKSGTIIWTNNWTKAESSISVVANSLPDDNKPHIRLTYSIIDKSGDDSEKIDYKVPLETTPCYFGGYRWWFTCPLSVDGKPCKRRVGVLYQAGNYFGCRHCYNLTYRSRNKNRRYYMQPVYDFLTNWQVIDALGESVKRSLYAGKPTRKLKRFQAAFDRQVAMIDVISKIV